MTPFHVTVVYLANIGGLVLLVRDLVKHYRKVRGCTQAQLSAASGISLATIKRMERGRTVSVLSLRRVAASLRIPPAEMASMFVVQP